MSSRAAERGREVRQRLLAAAVELIPEVGWTAVSTRGLAKRAGVTPSVVHYHFPSLSVLLNEAVIGLMRQVVAEVETVLDAAATPADAVDALLASLDAYTGTDPSTLLSIEAYLAATRNEPLREALGGLIQGFRQRFGAWLAEHEVASPDETAAVLVALLDGLLLHRGLGAGPDVGATAAVLRRLVEVKEADA